MQATIGNSLLLKLKPGNRPYDVRNNKLKGFLIRVNISGKLVYMCKYTRGKRVTLGKASVLTATQARDMAKEVLADNIKGNDPRIAKKPEAALTLRHYLDKEYEPWFKASRKCSKSLDNLKHFSKQFGDKLLLELSPLLLEKWRTKRLEAGTHPATVNRTLQL